MLFVTRTLGRRLLQLDNFLVKLANRLEISCATHQEVPKTEWLKNAETHSVLHAMQGQQLEENRFQDSGTQPWSGLIDV